jgi:RNA-directed DNA polymerase
MKAAVSAKRPGIRARPKSAPTYALDQCPLYKLRSKGRLANLLGVELARLKDLVRYGQNYREFPLFSKACPFTGKPAKRRWVQEPKAELKRIHDRLRKLLARVTPPDYAHGAITGRSYRSNAGAHASWPKAATFDLRDFYPSTKEVRVHHFFGEILQCSPDVAYLLAKLACVGGALPTGSPLSPILSLYANKPMMDRLEGMAQVHRLTFTVYIDDLTFSGAALPLSLKANVKRIVEGGGHQLADHKTKIFGRRHAKHITGIAVHNGTLRVPHTRFLKARALQQAISNAVGADQVVLQRRLAGLLGEAAFIDSRIRPWSAKAQDVLRALLAAERE